MTPPSGGSPPPAGGRRSRSGSRMASRRRRATAAWSARGRRGRAARATSGSSAVPTPASPSRRSAPRGGGSASSAPTPDTGGAAATSFEDERDLVDEAPAPVLAGLGRADDRMTGFVRVLRRMPVRRLVAAADLPADLAHPKMEPAIAGRQAVLAAGDRLGQLGDLDLVEVGADG